MSPIDLAAFLVLTGFAAYVQTLTGFAFGLLTMGGIGLTGLMPLPDAAVLVSVLTLTNAAQMLLKGWRDVAWRSLGLVMLGSLPAVAAGFVLLHWLSGSRADLLRLVLGAVIIGSCLQLALDRAGSRRDSPPASFVVFGALAGLMGGLFSTSGPPVVYHLHRQPWTAARIRETLVSIFVLNATLRLVLVAVSPDRPSAGTLWGLAAIPVVSLATHAARRWPPPISTSTLRRVVLVLLFLSGVSLAAPAMVHMLAKAG